jgi:hypothetical protein
LASLSWLASEFQQVSYCPEGLDTDKYDEHCGRADFDRVQFHQSEILQVVESGRHASPQFNGSSIREPLLMNTIYFVSPELCIANHSFG